MLFDLVVRFVGFDEWLSLPWNSILPGTLAAAVRVMAGLPLATLWLSPLILLAMLCNAWFRRLGIPVVVVGLSLSSVLLKAVFGQPLLADSLSALWRNAGQALAGASGQGLTVNDTTPPAQSLEGMVSWAWHDFVAALQATASPIFLAALAVSAGLFMVLVLWRRGGAGASS